MRISQVSAAFVLGLSIFGTACTPQDNGRATSELTREVQDLKVQNEALKLDNKGLLEALEVAKSALAKVKDDKLSDAEKKIAELENAAKKRAAAAQEHTKTAQKEKPKPKPKTDDAKPLTKEEQALKNSYTGGNGL